jgi:hypothetical protein
MHWVDGDGDAETVVPNAEGGEGLVDVDFDLGGASLAVEVVQGVNKDLIHNAEKSGNVNDVSADEASGFRTKRPALASLRLARPHVRLRPKQNVFNWSFHLVLVLNALHAGSCEGSEAAPTAEHDLTNC